MFKQKSIAAIAALSFFSFLISNLILAPSASALSMPVNGNDLAQMYALNAKSYVVMDVNTGQMLVDKSSNTAMTPASLTKLLTIMVLLDTKPKLTKTVAISSADQIMGACGKGGGCIKAKPGVRFTVDGLIRAALMPSANNAAAALAHSTGLTNAQFAARMNAKAKSLGATHSYFVEPTGMSKSNVVTASDYAKIIASFYTNPYLRGIAQTSSFYLRSSNNAAYNQTIKNSDKLLNSNNVQMLGAKTGYLTYYNFASVLNYSGHKLAIVVLGEPHLYTAFNDTESLADIAAQTKDLFALR